jgi:hypothetical protein
LDGFHFYDDEWERFNRVLPSSAIQSLTIGGTKRRKLDEEATPAFYDRIYHRALQMNDHRDKRIPYSCALSICLRDRPLIPLRMHYFVLVATLQLLALKVVVPCIVQSHYIQRSELSSQRNLLIGQEFFRSNASTVLGALNLTAGMDNPLKGLVGGARWAPPPLLNTVPLSMEWYNLGLDEIMVGDNMFN